MADVRCSCHEGTCPPCAGRCLCGFQKAETGLIMSVGILLILAIIFGIFYKRLRHLWKRSNA